MRPRFRHSVDLQSIPKAAACPSLLLETSGRLRPVRFAALVDNRPFTQAEMAGSYAAPNGFSQWDDLPEHGLG